MERAPAIEKKEFLDLYNIESWSGISDLASKYEEGKLWQKANKIYLLFLAEMVNKIVIFKRITKDPRNRNLIDEKQIFDYTNPDTKNVIAESGKISLQRVTTREVALANLPKIKDFLCFFIHSQGLEERQEEFFISKITELYDFLKTKIDLLYKSQEKPDIQEVEGQDKIEALVSAWLENGGYTQILPIELLMMEYDWTSDKKKTKEPFNPLKQVNSIKNSTFKNPILEKYQEAPTKKPLQEYIPDLIATKLKEISDLPQLPSKLPSKKGVLKDHQTFGKTLGIKINAQENDVFDSLPLHLLDIDTVIKSRGEGRLGDSFFINTIWTQDKVDYLKDVFKDVFDILFNYDPQTKYFSYKLRGADLDQESINKLTSAGITNHYDIIGKIMGFRIRNSNEIKNKKPDKGTGTTPSKEGLEKETVYVPGTPSPDNRLLRLLPTKK